MKINIHETLMNLNRGRITVDQAHDEIESAMCEANACPQLCEGWRDVREELPSDSNMVLGAWIETCGDVKLWNYAVVKYNRYNQNEWMKDTEVVKVEFWKVIDPPAFA